MIGPELYRIHMKQAKLAKAERAYWQKRRKEEAERYYEIVGRKPEGRKDDKQRSNQYHKVGVLCGEPLEL